VRFDPTPRALFVENSSYPRTSSLLYLSGFLLSTSSLTSGVGRTLLNTNNGILFPSSFFSPTNMSLFLKADFHFSPPLRGRPARRDLLWLIMGFHLGSSRDSAFLSPNTNFLRTFLRIAPFYRLLAPFESSIFRSCVPQSFPLILVPSSTRLRNPTTLSPPQNRAPDP